MSVYAFKCRQSVWRLHVFLSLRMTTIHGKTKSNQLSRIGLTVVFDEYTGTGFMNLKTLNHEYIRIYTQEWI